MTTEDVAKKCERETVSNQKVILVAKNDEFHQPVVAHLYSIFAVNQRRFIPTLSNIVHSARTSTRSCLLKIDLVLFYFLILQEQSNLKSYTGSHNLLDNYFAMTKGAEF